MIRGMSIICLRQRVSTRVWMNSHYKISIAATLIWIKVFKISIHLNSYLKKDRLICKMFKSQ